MIGSEYSMMRNGIQTSREVMNRTTDALLELPMSPRRPERPGDGELEPLQSPGNAPCSGASGFWLKRTRQVRPYRNVDERSVILRMVSYIP